MVTHHPTSNMLLEHAAGTSHWPVSLSISAHLQMCPQCRHQVYHLNHVGGALLVSSAPEEPSPGTFEQVMGQIELEEAGVLPPADETEPASEPNPEADEATLLGEQLEPDVMQSTPKSIRQLLKAVSELEWSAQSPHLKKASLTRVGDSEVALYRLSGGGKAPGRQHSYGHISLILSGYVSNDKGLYSPGDFLFNASGRTRPLVATQNADCIYLSVIQNSGNTQVPGWFASKFNSMRGSVSHMLSH